MRKKTASTWLEYIQSVPSDILLSGALIEQYTNQLLLLNKGFAALFYHSIPLVYLLDYTNGRYVTMSQAVETILGHKASAFTEGGLGFTIDHYQKDHLKIYNTDIFPDRLKILKTIPPASHGEYIFSYNFCMKTHKGDNVHLLQRNMFIQSDAAGNPLLSMGLVMNIEPFYQPYHSLQVIEKLVDPSLHTPPEAVFKKSYYLHGEDQLFSKREKEILLWMAEGYTSKDIAGKLFISEGTVIIHRKHMLLKTGMPNVAALIAYAVRHGII